jgi:hypothetical protein
MNRIVFLVNLIELSDIEEKPYLSHDCPEVAEVVELANKYLITDTGQCNWYNINILISGGLDIFPVEQDSFGWMLGGISTSKGVIVYG